MTRILHIPNFYAPNNGGIEKICQLVVNSLPAYEHQVLCFNTDSSTTTDFIDGVKVTRIGRFVKVASQSLSLSYYFKLKALIKSFKPDLIHFHAPNPLVMFFVNRLVPHDCKLIVHWHSDIIEQRRLYRFVKPIEATCLKRADRIIATSQLYADHSLPLRPFLQKVSILPCAIETEQFSEERLNKHVYEKLKVTYQGKKVIFFIGRHVPYKGLTFLLQAERFIKNDCVIVIGGSGPLTAALKKENTSSRIHFLGHLSEDELLAYFNLADIFAFPSITKNEAFGVVLAEAMYCKTPPVTFTIDGSGVNWVSLHNQTGLEVDNMNVKKFAEALDELLANDELRTSLANNAKLRIETYFTSKAIRKTLEEIYTSLLAL